MRMLDSKLRRVLVASTLLCLCAGVMLAQSETPEGEAPPKKKLNPRDPAYYQNTPDSGVEEHVRVELAEFKVLVTDKQGKAISDLRPEEIRVLEDGVEQRLAFLDSVIGGRTTTTERPLEERSTAQLFAADGEEAPDQSGIVVLPPKERRRIVLAFDVKNSHKNVRDDWKLAALDWLKNDMQPDDWVSIVVIQSYAQWLTGFTSDPHVLTNALENISLERSAANTDRGREMTDLVKQIQELCIDTRGADHRANERRRPRSDMSGEELSCGFNLTEGFVAEWNIEALETVGTLRSIVGQLAAVPGRKAVILFSEGVISDASMAGVNAMLSVLGTSTVDITRVLWQLNKNATREIGDLQNVARAGDVSFFTLNTTRYQDTGTDFNLESGQTLAYQSTAVNPWNEMRWDVQGTLSALAKETGGRAYNGIKDLEEKVVAAADGFFGLYVVGYYRADPDRPMGKLKIEVDRKKLKIDYPDRPGLWPHRPDMVKMDMSIGSPRPSTDEPGKQHVPLALTIPFDRLPLRRGHGGRGLQLGVFVEAVRPDGSVAAQSLEVTAIVAKRKERSEAKGKLYRYETGLALEPGSYRIRARFSDDRQDFITDLTVDLTVTAGGQVEPGLRAENTPSD